MKEYKKIQPEVIIGLGEGTEFIENPRGSKIVSRLHINLENWLGDDLLECYPCYIITEKMKHVLEISAASGYEIKELIVTLDEEFHNNYRYEKPVPNFYWLEIPGREYIDDLYLGKEKDLHISQYLLDILMPEVTLKYLEIDPGHNEFDDLLDQMIDPKK